MGVFVRDGRLRAGWRVTFYLLVYLFGMLVLQMVVLGAYSTAILLQGRETLPELTERLLALELPLWLFTALKAVEMAWIVLLTWLFGRFIDRRHFLDFGLRRADGWLDDTILGLVLGAAQMVAIVSISWLAGWLKIVTLPYAISAASLRYTALGLLLFVLVAVGEELLFRGYVQTNLQEKTSAPAGLRAAHRGSVRDRPKQVTSVGAGLRTAHRGSVRDRPKQVTSAGAGLRTASDHLPAAVALAVTSILFGLFHALNPNLTGLSMLNLILAGVALGMGYRATGSLWLPIAYHLSWNFIQGPILGLPVSGMRYGGLVMVADWGKAPLLTGHTFGPEGGLLGTVMLLGTVGVFWWWGRETKRV